MNQNQTIINTDTLSKTDKFWSSKFFKLLMILLGIGIILYLVYRSGRNTVKENAKKIPILKIENDGSIDENFKSECIETVKEIFRVTDGVDWWNAGFGGIKSKQFEAKNQIYGKILKMTRPQLFYLYNLYNLTHYPKTEETMAQAIISDQASFIQNSPDNETKLIAKMQALKMP
jgi:hypothetical protein